MLSEEQAVAISAKWSLYFTQYASGGDIQPFMDMFAETAQTIARDKTLTFTKGDTDPASGIVSFAMIQEKMAPEMKNLGYLQTIMTCKGVLGNSFAAEIKRYNKDWQNYYTQSLVIEVDDAGLITTVRAFSSTTDSANTAMLSFAK